MIIFDMMEYKIPMNEGSMLMLKSVLYRIAGTAVLVVILAFTGNVRLALAAGAVEFPCKLGIYFGYEKFWNYLSYKIDLWEKYSE